jgi:hypothetical protein
MDLDTRPSVYISKSSMSSDTISAVCDEKTLTIDHIGYHHDLVDTLIRELERCLRSFYVECHNNGVRRALHAQECVQGKVDHPQM